MLPVYCLVDVHVFRGNLFWPHLHYSLFSFCLSLLLCSFIRDEDYSMVHLWPYHISCYPKRINHSSVWINVGMITYGLDWRYFPSIMFIWPGCLYKTLYHRSPLVASSAELFILDHSLNYNWNPLMGLTDCMNWDSHYLIWLFANDLPYLFSWELFDRNSITRPPSHPHQQMDFNLWC